MVNDDRFVDRTQYTKVYESYRLVIVEPKSQAETVGFIHLSHPYEIVPDIAESILTELVSCYNIRFQAGFNIYPKMLRGQTNITE